MSSVFVAIASTDGVMVDQSLQEASVFRVYDVSLKHYRFVEERVAVVPPRAEGRPAPSSLGFNQFMDLLSDCSLLLVSSLGVEAGGKIQIGGITVYEVAMRVEKALKKFSQSPLTRNAFGHRPDRLRGMDSFGELKLQNTKRGRA